MRRPSESTPSPGNPAACVPRWDPLPGKTRSIASPWLKLNLTLSTDRANSALR